MRASCAAPAALGDHVGTVGRGRRWSQCREAGPDPVASVDWTGGQSVLRVMQQYFKQVFTF